MTTLDPIRVRLEAATPGPWFLDAGGDTGVYTEARVSTTSTDVASAFRPEDEAFIANAPTDIRRLLNALDAALDAPELTDHQHGDLNFMDGWAAAIEEVHTRINKHLGEP